MRQVRILAVGKLKTPHWKAAAQDYALRLSHTLRLEEVTAKDGAADLPPEQRAREETSRLLALARPSDALLCMDERGEALTSRQFAALLRGMDESGKTPCFLIGGAYGLGEEAGKRAARVLSLGPMTLPHELARVVLLEQIYRAQSIILGTGYHH